MEEKIEKFTYLWQPPKRWTFEMPKVKKYVEKEAEGLTLNLFAGKTRLRLREIRVDASPEFGPDYCIDCIEFLKMWIKKKKPLFDTIILDPPYSLRKANELYNGNYTTKWIQVLKMAGKILKPRGKAICLGFNSVGFSNRKGFKKEAICLVCHGGGAKRYNYFNRTKKFHAYNGEMIL